MILSADPESMHTSPWKVNGNSRAKGNVFKEKRGGGVQTKKPSVGGLQRNSMLVT